MTADSVLAHLRRLPPDRAPGRPGHRPSREVLRSTLESWGLPVRVESFRWDGLPGVDLVNLVVVLPGPSDDAPIVMACAHYDTVPGTEGADDNGSGTAALLELARRLASRELSAELRLLWFDVEEAGMVGSHAYVRGLSEAERRRVVGLVNLESIGYTDRRPGSQHMPPGSEVLFDPGDVGDFLLVVGNQASQELADTVALGLSAEEGDHLRVEVFSALPGEGWIMPDSRRSDHSMFWDAGIRAVMLTDTAPFRNPNYHRAGDRLATLDGEFMAAVTRGVERALILLAEDG